MAHWTACWIVRGIACATLLVMPCIALGQASVRDAHYQRDIDVTCLQDADKLIGDAVATGKTPGAVLLIGRGDEVIYRKAYGSRSLKPTKVAETADTIFDMASLTKVVATAPSIIILAQQGKFSVSDKVAKYIPEFAANGKQDITIEQLLLHHSGFIPDNDLSDYSDGPAIAWKKLFALPLKWPANTRFVYSDVNFEILGKLVEVVSGKPLNVFASENIFQPLKMAHTGYLPPAEWKPLIAPTQERNSHWMIGEVHDPRSFALGGVAGHAGLFSTADDLSRFCRMLLHGGILDGSRVFTESTYQQMIVERKLPDGTGGRGYGFDIDTPYAGCRGERFERGTTFGHTGFTGTMFWVDPAHQCYFILLTNSVHPDGKGSVVKLRRDVATAVGEALLGRIKPTTQPTTTPSTRPALADVLCGIDVLEQQNFAPLQGKRIALVTNHTGLNREGKRTVDILATAKGVQLVKLFSPEHGLFGLVDAKVSDAIDPATKLHVYSLYGKTEKPTPEMLQGVDAIVYDIQDVGARFYTYTSTLGLCMQAAADAKISMVVLDRPNPITGLICDGPLADEDALNFIAFAPIPISHGMTHGELARMFNETRNIHCNLTIVPLQNWNRGLWWDQTSRLWTNPSPNMRNPNQALLYSGICLLEATNVSVGRGADQPFEMFGAPWIDARKLAASLNTQNLPGLRFVPIQFTPGESKFAKQLCNGCYIEVIDREAVRPVEAGILIARTLKDLFGDKIEIDKVGTLLRSKSTLDALKAPGDVQLVVQSWQKPLDAFKITRGRYLMYP